MDFYGIQGNSLQWLKNCFKNWQQHMENEKIKTNAKQNVSCFKVQSWESCSINCVNDLFSSSRKMCFPKTFSISDQQESGKKISSVRYHGVIFQ